MAKDLDLLYPALSDLRSLARKRIPKFAFEYLDSATGRELGAKINRDALDQIQFMPAILQGEMNPSLKTTFMGKSFDCPFGIAPLGMSGLIWPGAEPILARAASAHNIPYSMSTVATKTPEDMTNDIGENGWFQLYAPKSDDVLQDMLKRIKNAGWKKLIVTVDVTGESRRERQRRANISMPPRITLGMIASMIAHPKWTLELAKTGTPRMRFPESYGPSRGKSAYEHAGHLIRGWPDWDYIARIRDLWQGDILIKGVMVPDDAKPLVDMGIDGLWVSNHTGRQLENAPASITQLPKIRAAVGPDVPIAFDSGVIGGLDIMRALALGADFVFLGRGFHYAVCAVGAQGVDHFIHILREDMVANMAQIGAQNLNEIEKQLVT